MSWTAAIAAALPAILDYFGDEKERDKWGETKQLPLSESEQWTFDRQKELYEYSPARDYMGQVSHGMLQGMQNQMGAQNPQFASKHMQGFQMPKFDAPIDFSKLPKFWEKGQYSASGGANAGVAQWPDFGGLRPNQRDPNDPTNNPNGLNRGELLGDAGVGGHPAFGNNGLEGIQHDPSKYNEMERQMLIDAARRYGPEALQIVTSFFGGAALGAAAKHFLNRFIPQTLQTTGRNLDDVGAGDAPGVQGAQPRSDFPLMQPDPRSDDPQQRMEFIRWAMETYGLGETAAGALYNTWRFDVARGLNPGYTDPSQMMGSGMAPGWGDQTQRGAGMGGRKGRFI